MTTGGKSPDITPSPHLAAQEGTDIMLTEIESSSRGEQKQLKEDCLQRDGFRCAVSRCYDATSVRSKKVQPPVGALSADTECAHIIPFGLRKFDEDKQPQAARRATIWWALYRYFPSLKGKISAATVNERTNAFTLWGELHKDFGKFRLAFRPTNTVSALVISKL